MKIYGLNGPLQGRFQIHPDNQNPARHVEGDFPIDEFEKPLTPRTRPVAMTQM